MGDLHRIFRAEERRRQAQRRAFQADVDHMRWVVLVYVIGAVALTLMLLTLSGAGPLGVLVDWLTRRIGG